MALTTDTQTSANPASVTGTGRLDNSLREALANMISNNTRQDTPFMSSMKTESVGREVFDWLTDEDADPIANMQVQGSTWADVDENGRTRLYNYTQIGTKNISVADSARAADAAGVSDEYKYQMMKRARELKKDFERNYIEHPGNGSAASNGDLDNVVKYAFDGTNAAGTGTVWTWVKHYETAAASTVIELGADTFGTNNTVSAGSSGGKDENSRANGTSVIYDTGSATSLTRAKVNDLLVKIYEAGQGNPSLAMMSPSLKVRFSEVYSRGQETAQNDLRRIQAAEKMIGTAIEKIMTDFGFVIGAVPNWLMTDAHGSDGSSILFYEPSAFIECIFRPYSEKPLGQDGDRTIGMVRKEAGVKCVNPGKHGVILNVN